MLRVRLQYVSYRPNPFRPCRCPTNNVESIIPDSDNAPLQSIPDRVRSQLSDQYTFERELLGGGMARVYLAHDRELDRRVVIKVLPPDIASGVSAGRFRAEILTVAKLQHPHIVGILRAGEVDGIPYFVMPYVDGESLAVRLRKSGAASVRETVAVFRDVARALAFAHSNGI